MTWTNRYLTIRDINFGRHAPDPESGFVRAAPERPINIQHTLSGLGFGTMPPGVTVTRLTIAGGSTIAIPSTLADRLRNMIPGTEVNIQENYTLSTGRLWVNAIVVKAFDTTFYGVQPGPDGAPLEEWFTYTGFEAVVIGRTA